jgi:arylsulfatase A-like enzyme
VGLLLLGLFCANLLASYFLTDFWAADLALLELAGIYSSEFLAITIVFLLLSLLSILISRLTGISLTIIVFCLAVLPIAVFVLASWSFYVLFEKFPGWYGLQMLRHDGARVIGIGSGMGAVWSSSLRIVLHAIALLLVFGFLAFSTSALGRTLQIVGKQAALACVIFATAAIAYPDLYRASDADNLRDPGYHRIKEAETLQLKSVAGPVSSLVAEIASATLLRNSTDAAVLQTMDLEPIAGSSNAPSSHVEKERFPNIVFILVESMNPDVLAVNGSGGNIMPSVDALINEGYYFSNVWAQSSHSNYADIAALSGQYPLRSENIHFYPTNPGYPRSLPWEHLSQFGYRAAGFSSGDDNWGRMDNYIQSANLEFFDHAGNEGVQQEGRRVTNARQLEELEDGAYKVDISNFMLGGSRTFGTSRLDGITTERALAWIDGKPADQPFFIYLNYQASHYPFTDLPESFERKHLTEQSTEADLVRRGNTLDMPFELVEQSYYDALLYVDQNISKLVRHIEQRSKDNTLYIIAADTSTHMQAHLLGNGGALDETVLRIPLIIAGTGVDESRTIDTPMAQIDIVPTSYGLLDLPADPASQGEDVILHPDPDRYIFSVAQSPAAHQYSVVQRDWQLLVNHDTKKISARFVGREPNAGVDQIPHDIKVDLASRLDQWVSAQLGYYNSRSYHTRYYPPSYANIVGKKVVDPASRTAVIAE